MSASSLIDTHCMQSSLHSNPNLPLHTSLPCMLFTHGSSPMVKDHLALLLNLVLPPVAEEALVITSLPFHFVPPPKKEPWPSELRAIFWNRPWYHSISLQWPFKTDWVLQLKKQKFLLWGLVYKQHGWKYIPAQGFLYSWGWRNEQSQGPKRPI